jgi:hypothetical protein
MGYRFAVQYLAHEKFSLSQAGPMSATSQKACEFDSRRNRMKLDLETDQSHFDGEHGEHVA